jgi:hypothetical protein
MNTRMSLLTWLLVGLVILLLVACGGGGPTPKSNPTPPNPAPLPQQYEASFGYFMGNAADLPLYQDHVGYVFTNDWGNWDTAQDWLENQTLLELQNAQQFGIKKAIVSVGFLVFDSKYNYKGTQYLIEFKGRLENLGISDMVETFYVLDEPDLAMRKGLTVAALKAACAGLRQVFPEVKLMTIYSNSGQYPAITAFDIVGKDDYGKGTGVLSEMPPITSNQWYAIVPGGADPWKQDPTQFYQWSLSHPVKYIIAFLFSDYSGGKGIGNNGMLPVYKALGQKIKAQSKG